MTHSDTVFIIDDDASVRDALSLALSLRGRATATFASGEDFLTALQPHWRGCVVADIRMPGMSGLELQRSLRERGVTLPVIVITAHGDVAAARQAFLADAVDFLVKPFDSGQLLQAVDKALEDQAEGRGRTGPAVAPTPDQLTAREREVMALLVKGLHNRSIAKQLGISPRTVEVHKARVMEKLGAHNIVDLVRIADRAES